MVRPAILIGFIIALALVAAGIGLLVLTLTNPLIVPRPVLTDRFCAWGVEWVGTLINKSYLTAPMDERCDVVFGPYSAAIVMALVGLVGVLILGPLALITRARRR